MKRFIRLLPVTFIFFYAFAASTRAADVPPNTAFYCILNSSNLIGENATVNVSNVRLLTAAPLGNYLVFECETSFGGMFGGYIKAIVPTWRAQDFFKNYYVPKGDKRKEALKPLTARLENYVWPDNTREYLLVVSQ